MVLTTLLQAGNTGAGYSRLSRSRIEQVDLIAFVEDRRFTQLAERPVAGTSFGTVQRQITPS